MKETQSVHANYWPGLLLSSSTVKESSNNRAIKRQNGCCCSLMPLPVCVYWCVCVFAAAQGYKTLGEQFDFSRNVAE